MTREGQGIGPEDSPPPPVSTRRSEPDPEEAADLLPPFVPGRKGRPADAVADTTESVADTDDVVSETTEAVADTVEPEPVATSESDDEAFPFDEPDTGQPWSTEPEADLSELEEGRAEPETGAYADPATDMADRLEQLASRLRSEGAGGIEAEMASSDRIVSMLAALIAGYLAGRDG